MNIDRNAPVGVFDSGIGGLTVAREIMRNLPSEKIVYFGDTARVPYGSKSRETVIRYSRLCCLCDPISLPAHERSYMAIIEPAKAARIMLSRDCKHFR